MVKGSGGNSNRFRNLHLDIRVLSLHCNMSSAPADSTKQVVLVEMTHVWTVIVVGSKSWHFGCKTRPGVAPDAQKSAVNGAKTERYRKKVEKAHFRAGQVTGSGI